jgi:hypothetical protein
MRTNREGNVELGVSLKMNALPADASDITLEMLQVILASYGVNTESAAIVHPPVDARMRGRRHPRSGPRGDALPAPPRKHLPENGSWGNDAPKQGLPDLRELLDVRGRTERTGYVNNADYQRQAKSVRSGR